MPRGDAICQEVQQGDRPNQNVGDSQNVNLPSEVLGDFVGFVVEQLEAAGVVEVVPVDLVVRWVDLVCVSQTFVLADHRLHILNGV